MGKRPGIMVYFDMLDALEEYEAEERGLLFTAMLRYGLYGEIPEFEDRGMRTIWKSAQQKIDLDGVRYENTCNGRRYSAYHREAKKRGEEPLSREAWEQMQREDLSNDITCNQQQPQPQQQYQQQPQQQLQQQPQHQFQPQNININNNPSTNNQQPMYNNQPAAHNGKGLVCTAEEMAQMYNEAMTRFGNK